jgi:hypothetical protein
MINYILLKTGIKDLYFYWYIWRFIRKNRNSDMWKQFNLRHDWIGRMYTVQSYTYEDVSLPEDVRYALVMDKMRPLIDWLQSNNLGEIVMPDVKKISDTYSYLVKFSPLFYEISFSWLFFRALIAYAIYLIYPYAKNLIEHVLPR